MRSHPSSQPLYPHIPSLLPYPHPSKGPELCPNIPSQKCASGRQNLHLLPSEEVGKSSPQKSIMKMHKLIKTTISTLWKSAKSVQPWEKCLCLKTAELQVQTLSLQLSGPGLLPYHRPSWGDSEILQGGAGPEGQQLPRATGEGKSHSLEQWVMAKPNSIVHGNYHLGGCAERLEAIRLWKGPKPATDS